MNLDFLYDVQCDESAAWIRHNHQPVDPSDNQERNDWQDAEDDLQEDEYDGQPDEAQEWEDFDPDC